MLVRLLKATEAAELVGYFVASGLGATGLTVTVDVWRRQPAGAWTEIVTGASATQIGDGGYEYQLSGASVTAGASYFYVFKTAGTADQKHVAGYCACETDYTTTRAANIDTIYQNASDTFTLVTDKLDATVASRLAAADYTAPPSAASVATAVWANATRTLTSLSALAADIASAVWGALIATYNTGTAFGGWLQTQLDATIASRLASSAVVVRSNTAVGGAATYATLDTGASAVDDYYNGAAILLTGGTGAGQSRMIADYTGSTKRATPEHDWVTAPDATTTYTISVFADPLANAVGRYPSGSIGYSIGTIVRSAFTVVAGASMDLITLYRDDTYEGAAALSISVDNDRALTVTGARLETSALSLTLTVVTGSGATLAFKISSNEAATTLWAATDGAVDVRLIVTHAEGESTIATGLLEIKGPLQ
mgnify:CR=1 FL=1